jgi:hypothetical protein
VVGRECLMRTKTPDSFMNEIALRARVYNNYPIEVKIRAIGKIPKVVPYDNNARDADGDGLVQEGTIWERPAGSRFISKLGQAIAAGMRAMPSSAALVDGDGKKITYKPGQHRNSPLRGGRRERRIRGRGQRRLRRAKRGRERAQGDRARVEEAREEIYELDEQIQVLQGATSEGSLARLLEAEVARGDEPMDENYRGFWDSFITAFTGVQHTRRQRDRSLKDRSAADVAGGAAIRAEGARRQAGAENDPDREREMEFDDQVLPPDVDRDEHRRKLDEDDEYAEEWLRRLLEYATGEREGYVNPPDREEGASVRPQRGGSDLAPRGDDADSGILIDIDLATDEQIDAHIKDQEYLQGQTGEREGGRPHNPEYLGQLTAERNARRSQGEWEDPVVTRRNRQLQERVDSSRQRLVEVFQDGEKRGVRAPNQREVDEANRRFPVGQNADRFVGMPAQAWWQRRIVNRWRQEGFEGRAVHLERESAELEEKFGKYYDGDGVLNERGKLLDAVRKEYLDYQIARAELRGEDGPVIDAGQQAINEAEERVAYWLGRRYSPQDDPEFDGNLEAWNRRTDRRVVESMAELNRLQAEHGDPDPLPPDPDSGGRSRTPGWMEIIDAPAEDIIPVPQPDRGDTDPREDTRGEGPPTLQPPDEIIMDGIRHQIELGVDGDINWQEAEIQRFVQAAAEEPDSELERLERLAEVVENAVAVNDGFAHNRLRRPYQARLNELRRENVNPPDREVRDDWDARFANEPDPLERGRMLLNLEEDWDEDHMYIAGRTANILGRDGRSAADGEMALLIQNRFDNGGQDRARIWTPGEIFNRGMGDRDPDLIWPYEEWEEGRLRARKDEILDGYFNGDYDIEDEAPLGLLYYVDHYLIENELRVRGGEEPLDDAEQHKRDLQGAYKLHMGSVHPSEVDTEDPDIGLTGLPTNQYWGAAARDIVEGDAPTGALGEQERMEALIDSGRGVGDEFAHLTAMLEAIREAVPAGERRGALVTPIHHRMNDLRAGVDRERTPSHRRRAREINRRLLGEMNRNAGEEFGGQPPEFEFLDEDGDLPDDLDVAAITEEMGRIREVFPANNWEWRLDENNMSIVYDPDGELSDSVKNYMVRLEDRRHLLDPGMPNDGRIAMIFSDTADDNYESLAARQWRFDNFRNVLAHEDIQLSETRIAELNEEIRIRQDSIRDRLDQLELPLDNATTPADTSTGGAVKRRVQSLLNDPEPWNAEKMEAALELADELDRVPLGGNEGDTELGEKYNRWALELVRRRDNGGRDPGMARDLDLRPETPDSGVDEEGLNSFRFFNDNQIELALREVSEETLGRIIRDEAGAYEGRRDEGGMGLREDALQRGDRASFQRLARLEVDRRREEVSPGKPEVDLQGLDDDELNARITRLIAADPVGDNAAGNAALAGALKERDRRAAGDPIASARIQSVSGLHDDQIAIEIEALPSQIAAAGRGTGVRVLRDRLLDLLTERNRREWERREAAGEGVIVDRVEEGFPDPVPELNPFGPVPVLEEGGDWEAQAQGWTVDQRRAWIHADNRRNPASDDREVSVERRAVERAQFQKLVAIDGDGQFRRPPWNESFPLSQWDDQDFITVRRRLMHDRWNTMDDPGGRDLIDRIEGHQRARAMSRNPDQAVRLERAEKNRERAMRPFRDLLRQRPSFDDSDASSTEWDERFREYEVALQEEHSLETILRAQSAIDDLQDDIDADADLTVGEKNELFTGHRLAWNELGDVLDDMRNIVNDGDRSMADGVRAEILLEKPVWNGRQREGAEQLLEDIMPGFSGHLDSGIKRRLEDRLAADAPDDRAAMIFSEEHARLYEELLRLPVGSRETEAFNLYRLVQEANVAGAYEGYPESKVRELFNEVEQIRQDESILRRLDRLTNGPHTSVDDVRARQSDALEFIFQAANGRVDADALEAAIAALAKFEGGPARDLPRGRHSEYVVRLRKHRGELIELLDALEDDDGDRVHGVLDSGELAALDMAGVRDHVNVRLAVLSENLAYLRRVGSREAAGNLVQGIVAINEWDQRISNVRKLIPEMAALRDALHMKRQRGDLAEQDSKERAISVAVRQALERMEYINRGDRVIPGRGVALDPLNDVPQMDFRDEADADALRGIADLRASIVKKIGRRGGRAAPGNDHRRGVPALDGHDANLDRAIADLERRRDRLPRGEARDKMVALRGKLITQKRKVQAERDIRQGDEDERIRRAEVLEKEAVGIARKAREFLAHWDEDHVRRRAAVVAPAADRNFDESTIAANLEEVDAVLAELGSLLDEAGQAQGLRVRNIPEARRVGDEEDLTDKVDRAKTLLKSLKTQIENREKFRLNEKWMDDNRGRVDEIRELIANREFEGLTTELQLIRRGLDAQPRLPRGPGSLGGHHDEVRERRRVFDNEIQNLYLQAEEAVAVMANADFLDANENRGTEILAVLDEAEAAGVAITPEAIESYLEEVQNLLRDLERLPNLPDSPEKTRKRRFKQKLRNEVEPRVQAGAWIARRQELGVEDPPEIVDANPAAGSLVRSNPRDVAALGRYSGGVVQSHRVEVGNKDINDQMGADDYVKRGGNLSEVPDDFLAKSIRANSIDLTGARNDNPSKRFALTSVGGGVNGLDQFRDRSTGSMVGVKFANGRAQAYGEDFNEIISARFTSELGLPAGVIRVGGRRADMGAGVWKVVPIVIDMGQNFTNYNLERPEDFLGGRLGAIQVEDLTRAHILDTILHHTDRHGGNYFQVMDADGKLHYYPVDNGMIDGARGGTMKSVQHRLGSGGKDSFAKHLRTKIGIASGNIASRERYLKTLRDIRERLAAMNPEEIVAEIAAMMPDGRGRIDDVDQGLGWFASRIRTFLDMTEQEILTAIFSGFGGDLPPADMAGFQ